MDIKIIYIIINIITFLIYGIDKKLAKGKKQRISEFSLLFLTFLFGGFGGIMGMKVFRHKTKKKKFIFFVPLFLFIQIYIYLMYIGLI